MFLGWRPQQFGPEIDQQNGTTHLSHLQCNAQDYNLQFPLALEFNMQLTMTVQRKGMMI